MERCTGCRSCELACSFHHRGIFKPAISSLKIESTPGKIGFTASLYKESAEEHIGCDRCQALALPMCVQFCPDLSRDELETLLKAGLPSVRNRKERL